jgi:hypothetical protein
MAASPTIDVRKQMAAHERSTLASIKGEISICQLNSRDSLYPVRQPKAFLARTDDPSPERTIRDAQSMIATRLQNPFASPASGFFQSRECTQAVAARKSQDIHQPAVDAVLKNHG